MKGISEILAVILIVIIVVALIGLTYTFSASLFQTTATATTTTTQAVTGNMQKTVDIVYANCYNTSTANYIINFTLRNSGTSVIAAQVSALLDNTNEITSTSIVPTAPSINVGSDTLAANQQRGYSYTGTQVSRVVGTRTLTVTSPAGSVSDPIYNCPA